MHVFVTGTRGIPDIMGGVETHCEHLCPLVAQQGVDVTVARRTTYATQQLDEWQGVRLVDIPSPHRKSLEAIVHTWRAINRARKMGADIVHIHSIGPALLAPWARLLGMKVVFTHHSLNYDHDKWGTVAKAMLRLGERLGCRWSNELIVVSRVIQDIVTSKYGRSEHVHLIPNGVDKPQPCSLPDYFASLGIEPGKYILAMGRFVPEKRMHHLVEAFAGIEEKHGVKLVLAGDSDFDDEYSRSLKEMARRSGVVLTGFVRGEQLHSLITHCRAFSLPSSHEGLPIALLEAMSYGARVVVSDIPANLEVGLDVSNYFPCGDVDALRRKLERVIEEPYSKVDYDMARYDWDAIAAQVMEVYRRAMGK